MKPPGGLRRGRREEGVEGGVQKKERTKGKKRNGKCLNVSRGNTKQNVDIFNT